MSGKQNEDDLDQKGFLDDLNASEFDPEIGFYTGLKKARGMLAYGMATHDGTDADGAIKLYDIADGYKEFLEQYTNEDTNQEIRNKAMHKINSVGNVYRGLNIYLQATKLKAGATKVASELDAATKEAEAKKAVAEANQHKEALKKMAENVAKIEAFEAKYKTK